MRGRTVLRGVRWGAWDPSLLRGLALAALFLAGALGGHLYAAGCGEASQAALGRYLNDYCGLYDAGGVAVSLGGCAAAYFGYAAALFLLGFSSVGAALIPALSGLFGFCSMYAVSCFVRCYGRAGVLLALGALAEAAWPMSIELFLLSFGRGKRSAPVLYGSRYFLLFVLCAVILAVGVCCERLVTPLLFRLAMGEVF